MCKISLSALCIPSVYIFMWNFFKGFDYMGQLRCELHSRSRLLGQDQQNEHVFFPISYLNRKFGEKVNLVYERTLKISISSATLICNIWRRSSQKLIQQKLPNRKLKAGRFLTLRIFLDILEYSNGSKFERGPILPALPSDETKFLVRSRVLDRKGQKSVITENRQK